MRPMRWWLILGAILLAGCGGSSAATQPSPTPNLGAEYTRIVKPINDAGDVLYTATPGEAARQPAHPQGRGGYCQVAQWEIQR